MDSTIHSDLIRGHIDTIILKALYDGDRYGFDIIKEIEQKSSGQYVLKQPTLYSCLKRLEVQGFIKSYWGSKSSGGRRKYYTLTDMGRDLFIRNQNEWVYSRTVIDKLISDRDFDLSSSPSSYDDSTDKSSADIDAESELGTENGDDIESESETIYNDTEAVDEDSEDDEEVDEISEDTAYTIGEADADKQIKEPIQYVDTTQLMQEIFEQQLRDSSYSENLRNEPYIPTESFEPDSYFRDTFDDEPSAKAVPDDDASYDMDEIIRRVDDARNNSPAYSYTENYDAADENYDAQQVQSEQSYINYGDTAAAQTPPSEEQPSGPEFYSYDSAVADADDSAVIIGREYKKILTELRDRNVAVADRQPQLTINEENEHPVIENIDDSSDFEETDDDLDSAEDLSQPLTSEQMRDRKFKILESQLRKLGDDIKIRTHSSGTSKQYANAYYFYSNKLMLSHYLILFLLMILEVSITYIAVSLSGVAQNSAALAFFIIGIIVSAAFPIVAFILNLLSPDKKKRITFNYKMSMIFRCIVMVEAFVLIYTVNLMLGMPATFSSEYLVTLLIPALMCTNIPVSSMIFQAMYKSRKYSIDD